MTITVTNLKSLNSGNEICVFVTIENNESVDNRQLVLLLEQHISLRIVCGEIDSERFDEIERESKICQAYKKGLLFLGYGACSEKKLIYKLKQKGFDEDISREAVEMLLKNGYIREDNDAVYEAEKCVSKLWGKKRIIAHLYSKGYSDNAIKAAILSLEEVDFTENCRKLIERSYKKQFDEAKKDAVSKNKLCSALLRMGYSFSEIKEASLMIAAD